MPRAKTITKPRSQTTPKKNVRVNRFPATKKYLLLYFHAHQPYRISNFSIFDVGHNKYYFDGPSDQENKYIVNRVAEKNYRPATRLMKLLAEKSGLKVAYSLSGVLLEQLGQWAPDVIDTYRDLYSTGKMELIAETYYHSLAFFYDHTEFTRQVNMHTQKLGELFGASPNVFRNTELTYRNDVGEFARNMGFKAIFAEGWDPILGWRSPNYFYKSKPVELSPEEIKIAKGGSRKKVPTEIKIIPKNYRLSDDVAFRFQLKGWEGYPVTADKYAQWVLAAPGEIVNLCMDYETIGEHHFADSGIFQFYEYLPEELAKLGIEFILPSEAADLLEAKDELDYPHIVSWADMERDLSAWMGNQLQQKSLESIYKVRDAVHAKLASLTEPAAQAELLDVWGKLQTSDHYYYMSTKYWSDGDVHKYFSPYKSPYEAFVTFQNVLRDFKLRYLGE